MSASTARSPLAGALLTALLTSFVAATYGFGFYLFAQLVPDMRADLGFDLRAAGLAVAAGQLGFLVFALGGAWAAPRIGGAQVAIGSVALCAAGLLLVPAAPDVLALGLLLGVLGGTAASVYVPMVEIVSRSIAYRHRGKALGLISSGTSYGVFVNSLLVPAFVLNHDWRGVWIAVGLGTAALALVAAIAFRRMGLLARETAPAADAPRAAGLRGRPAPWIVIVWATAFLNGLSVLPFQTFLSPYLREELGYPVAFAAAIWGVVGAIGMVSGFLVGWAADRTGVRLALGVTYACVLAAAALLALAPSQASALAAGILFAMAFCPIFGLVPAYVAKAASGAQATGVFGLANVALGLGGMTGNAAFGALAEAAGGFTPVYLAIAGLSAVLGLLCALLPAEGAPARPSVAAASAPDAPPCRP
jgi:predicted MFS family arabinose efflux permease